MACVPPSVASTGTMLGVGVLGLAVPAKVVALPFCRRVR
jgi:hypothetical protein